ncbi:MAG: alanine--glyoxylate aminotransferase family protein [Thermoanaerobaculia bacterium]|nr:alanine--glyoxylate aminotransferase family protein [Thermoanaerobaculia bacterium]
MKDTTIPGELDPPKRMLMGPGPSDAHPRVLRAMSAPLIGHLDPAFVEMMNEIKSMLRTLLRTENEMTFLLSGPGSAGMECCLVNLIEPGDEVVVCIHGVFGERMAEIAERAGATVVRVEAEWGTPIDPDDLREAVENRRPRLVAIVHAETSTGVLQPLEEISDITREAGALLVVDAVTSFGGVDLRVDEWGIDALYSGSQKCLSAPPGLSPVTFSDRAVRVVEERSKKIQSWFLDIGLLRGYWGDGKRAYHHTAPVSSCYAFREALRLVLEESLEERIARHRTIHELLKRKLEPLGFEFLVDEAFRLPQLNAVKLPDGLDDASARRRLLDEYGIEVGGGLGELAGEIWRIGIMGESCTATHVNALAAALEEMTV